MNNEHTSNTLDIDGIDAMSAITTSFMPSSFEMTLSGRNALKALKAFNAENYDISTPLK